MKFSLPLLILPAREGKPPWLGSSQISHYASSPYEVQPCCLSFTMLYLFICLLFFLVVVTSVERHVRWICSTPWTGKNWREIYLVQPGNQAQRQSHSLSSASRRKAASWDGDSSPKGSWVHAALCLSRLPLAEKMLCVSECLGSLREGKIRRRHLWLKGEGHVSITVTSPPPAGLRRFLGCKTFSVKTGTVLGRW